MTEIVTFTAGIAALIVTVCIASLLARDKLWPLFAGGVFGLLIAAPLAASGARWVLEFLDID